MVVVECLVSKRTKEICHIELTIDSNLVNLWLLDPIQLNTYWLTLDEVELDKKNEATKSYKKDIALLTLALEQENYLALEYQCIIIRWVILWLPRSCYMFLILERGLQKKHTKQLKS